MRGQISFKCSKKDIELINKIVDRAAAHVGGMDLEARLDFVKDLAATHCNGCPLDLQKLLEADEFNFVHDIGGIRRHINRETGQLENFFLPRCALPEVTA